jgi:catechol 2,3-dioxygenase-like lactoylglutathione lyase family enzyme
MDGDVSGILLVTIPVSDLERSVQWYRDVLRLSYVREFEVDGMVTVCGLADAEAGFGIQLRARQATAGSPDLRGMHPVVFRASDRAALDRFDAHVAALGCAPTRGEHADGVWVAVNDPDGIELRVMADVPRPNGFAGFRFAGEAPPTKYDRPQLSSGQALT